MHQKQSWPGFAVHPTEAAYRASRTYSWISGDRFTAGAGKRQRGNEYTAKEEWKGGKGTWKVGPSQCLGRLTPIDSKLPTSLHRSAKNTRASGRY